LAYLHAKQLLLVLDNFEELLEAAGLLAQLLDAAPQLKLLVTSREPLHLYAEWVLALHGLDKPHARELFVQRAQRTVADFAPNDADAQIILQVCEYVRGSPLAIELAAGWASALPLRVLAEQIQTDLDVLATPARDMPERQRSVRAIFEQTF
ncbi:MAG: SARP family transcriptional regulator, partial [Chloroflexi bacterium]|nr:SARP family transcriptional regulator [Chloroflexota bacterium]